MAGHVGGARHLVVRSRVLLQVVVAHDGGPEQRAAALGRDEERRLQVGEARLACGVTVNVTVSVTVGVTVRKLVSPPS